MASRIGNPRRAVATCPRALRRGQVAKWACPPLSVSTRLLSDPCATLPPGKGNRVASIEEVAKRVSQACDQASKCRDALGQAQDLAAEAHDLLAANLRGVDDLESDTEKMLARFTEVKDGITDLWRILGTGMDRAQAALTALTGGERRTTSPGRSTARTAAATATGATDVHATTGPPGRAERPARGPARTDRGTTPRTTSARNARSRPEDTRLPHQLGRHCPTGGQ